MLIAQEAGAAVTTMEGDPFSVFERSVVAAAPGVHEVCKLALRLAVPRERLSQREHLCVESAACWAVLMYASGGPYSCAKTGASRVM